MSIRVHDDIVQVCYKNNGHTLREFWAKRADEANDAAVLARLEESEGNFIGRENDILLLEHNLLMESNIGVLSGRARNGKTSLMKFLALWWHMTDFIAGTLWLDAEMIGKQQVLAHLQEAFQDSFGISMEVALDTLLRERYLIIFDSWESLECSEGSCLSQERKDFRGFLTALHGGQSLVLIISKRSEGWLSKLGPYTDHRSRWEDPFSQVLEGLSPIYGVQLFGSLLTNLRKSEDIVTDEDRSYLEHLVELAEGNPLVLHILSYDFSKRLISIIEYYNGLLDGAQIDFDIDWLEIEEGARNAVELLNTSHNQHIGHDRLIRSDTLADQLFRIGSLLAGGEILSLRDYCGAIPLTFYALTWTAMLAEDFWWLAFFFSLAVRKTYHDAGLWNLANRDGVDDMTEACLFAPAALPEVVQMLKESFPMFDAIEGMFDDLNQLLLIHGFLEPFSSDLINIPKKPFHRVHPLLPLVARHTPDYVECRKHLHLSFVYFQTLSINRWPHEYCYWNPIWNEPKLEMELTFVNFNVALRNALRLPPGSLILERIILRLISCVPRGLFADPSRHGLLIGIWKEAIPRTLDALKIMADASTANIETTLSKTLGPVASPDMERLALVQHYGLVLLQASQALMIAEKGSIIRSEVLAKSQVFRTAKAVIEAILCYKRLDKRGLNSTIDSLMFALRLNLKSIYYLQGHIGNDEFWASRQEFFQYQIQKSRVEEMPNDQETRTVPHAVNSMSVPFSPLIDVTTAVKTLLHEDGYASARSVLQRALASEINTAGNLAGNRMKLYQLLARVDKREGNWEDVIENLKRSYSVERSSYGAPSTIRRVEVEGKWAKLYEQAGHFDTMMSYMNVLLEKANAAHGNDAELEIEYLLRIYRLQFVKKYNSRLSDIFTLLRAALVSDRSETADISQRGSWMMKFMKLTTSRGSEWELGATAPDRYSVAIAFMLMIFGQLIGPHYLMAISNPKKTQLLSEVTS